MPTLCKKMHMDSCMRAYSTVQQLLCHGGYCELILSLARTSCRLLFTAHPTTRSLAALRDAVRSRNRPLVASKPDSSPPKRPGLDNITSQPCSEAACPCTTSASAYLRFVTIFLLEKTRQKTRNGGTGASCVRRWLTRDIVYDDDDCFYYYKK